MERKLKVTEKQAEILEELSLDELARILYTGYEVEEEFKKGDWIVNGFGTVFDLSAFQISKLGKMNVLMNIRHATPQEIVQEKERRTDKELKEGLEQLKIVPKYPANIEDFGIVSIYKDDLNWLMKLAEERARYAKTLDDRIKRHREERMPIQIGRENNE